MLTAQGLNDRVKHVWRSQYVLYKKSQLADRSNQLCSIGQKTRSNVRLSGFEIGVLSQIIFLF